MGLSKDSYRGYDEMFDRQIKVILGQ